MLRLWGAAGDMLTVRIEWIGRIPVGPREKLSVWGFNDRDSIGDHVGEYQHGWEFGNVVNGRG